MNNMQREKTRENIIRHCIAYPELQAEDLFKYIHQSALGCEHLVSDDAVAVEYIRKEYATVSKSDLPRVEPLDGDYRRVFLSCLNDGLKPETLARLFVLSAVSEPKGETLLKQKLQIAHELTVEGVLPFGTEIFREKCAAWQAGGYPAIHHSDHFRGAYHPAYRVVAKRFADFLPVFTEIDRRSENKPMIVALEGGSASGKTTLAEMLCRVYDCNVFPMDDFFLRPEQRTPARFAEIGGNVDRERFSKEVLRPLRKLETVCYRPFDCSAQVLGEPVTVHHKPLTLVEGVYSMHPAFSRYYDLSVFLDIAPEYQRKRISVRNPPQLALRFFNEWIPLENRYFCGTDIKKRADLILPISEE